jgi:PHD/YefM family antitoxin component YafN of YafNO toxin-antitoxin module
MNMVLEADELSMLEFTQDTHGYSNRARQDGRARILTSEGSPEVVILSINAYEQMAREAYEHRKNQELKIAIEEHLRGGPGTPAQEFFDELAREDESCTSNA